MDMQILKEIGPALYLTLRLAAVTVIVLLIIGTPLALWLSKTQVKLKAFIEALVALPLVLPPTVLGFYLLLALSPKGVVGGAWYTLTDSSLAFSFWGLVIGSVIYSLPFVVQPLQRSFESIGPRPLEVAASLRANKWDSFWSVIFPLSKNGFISAATLGFAHTLGEFGVVLMIGGNIPGKTQVLSIAIYESVETMEYTKAHVVSGALLIMSLVLISIVHRRTSRHFGGGL